MTKNNFKKICFYLVSSRGLLVVFFLLLLFSFGLAQDAKAINGETISGFYTDNSAYRTYYGTITAGENQILYCSAEAYYHNSPYLDIYWGTQQMTKFYTYSPNGWGETAFFYLVNPELGSHGIADATNISFNGLNCVVFENINQSDPVLNTPYRLDGTSISYTRISTSTSIVLASKYSGSSVATDWTDYSSGSVGSVGSAMNYGLSSLVSSSTYVTINSGSAINAFFVELNYNEPPPAPALSITSQIYNPVTGNVFLSGTCVQQGSGVQQLSLYAYDLGTSTPSMLNRVFPERSSRPSCIDGQWTGVFDGGIIPANDNYTGFDLPALTGANRLVIDDTFFGTQIATVDQTWQDVTGYIRFNYGDLNTINIDTSYSGGATTTLNFIYNICDDPDYSATSSKIWVVNQTGSNFENTSFGAEDFYQATTCSGVGSVSFHLNRGQAGTVRAYFAYANSYGVQYLKSGLFYLVANYNIQQCNPPSYNVSNICAGIDTSGTLGYVQCSIKFALVASGQFLFYPSCESLNDITSNYGKFKHAFPFNTYFDFTNSINTAIDSAMSTTTTTNNISIPFIRQTATSSEYYMMPVISSTTVSNTIGTDNYNTMRTTIGYIWWVLCGFIIFFIVAKL